MKIISWNVNSLNVRKNQVLNYLDCLKSNGKSCDFLCLQELKMDNEAIEKSGFISELKNRGYKFIFNGQKVYNGVGIIYADHFEVIENSIHSQLENLVELGEVIQSRIISAEFYNAQQSDKDKVFRLICGYMPNGGNYNSDKYHYKLRWYDALTEYLKKQLAVNENIILCGDFNIAPSDDDVYNKTQFFWRLTEQNPKHTFDNSVNKICCCSYEEREKLDNILELNFTDSYRYMQSKNKQSNNNKTKTEFTWWDYRNAAFKRNEGLRIDLILTTPNLTEKLTAVGVEKSLRENPRPSDHAAIFAEIDF